MTKRAALRTTGAVVGATLALGIGWQLRASWESRPVDLSSLSLEQWRDDLHYMAGELANRHANAFHRVSRGQYWRLVARIDSALPALAAADIPVYFEKVTAAVGDAHTYVSLSEDQHFYPFAIYYFGDTPRVVRAAPPFQQLLGARLAKVGDLSTSEVEARLNEILTQGENVWFYRAEYPGFLSREVLHALGVLRDGREAVFTFARADGSTTAVPMRSSATGPQDWILPYKTAPLYIQHSPDEFWFTTLPNTNTVYVAFNSYRHLRSNAAALFRYLDSHVIDRLIIDMRTNRGGDYLQGHKHLIARILERPRLNQPGHLYVITGRYTFSAAMSNAAQFRTETHATLVGEPPGEVPNGYQEHRSFRLPHSHLVVNYSVRYYKFLATDVPALLPDTTIEPDWHDYQAGRDPVLEWIIASSPAKGATEFPRLPNRAHAADRPDGRVCVGASMTVCS